MNVIQFCNKLSTKYQVNIRLCYLNKELNYSGKYVIHNCNLVCNIQYSYWYGLYLFNYDKFWATVSEIFEYFIDFESLLKGFHLQNLEPRDLQQLHNHFTNFLNMKYLDLAFKKL